MAEGLVLDASAALALLLGESGGARVRQVLRAQAGSRILVLDLFWHETVNALVRRQRWQAEAVVEALRELDELGVETVQLDRPLLLASLDLASMLGLTAYDAAHLALAEAADARLLTLDEGLVAVAGTRSVIRGDRGVHEARAPYRTSGEGMDWARHGPYLAELRRAADRRATSGTIPFE